MSRMDGSEVADGGSRAWRICMVAVDVKGVTRVMVGCRVDEIDIVSQVRHISSPLSPTKSRGGAPGRKHLAVRLVEVSRISEGDME